MTLDGYVDGPSPFAEKYFGVMQRLTGRTRRWQHVPNNNTQHQSSVHGESANVFSNYTLFYYFFI